jgi:multiple sugar transport system ATP-binding protein
MRSKLDLQNIGKAFDGRWVVKDFSLTVAEGEFVALLGPSGCGKSTIIATIAGFLLPDSGTICVDGQGVDHLPPQRRNLGLVMQDYAVFSMMTVRRNLEFGLAMRSVPKPERNRTVEEFAARMSLTSLLNRRAGTLNLSEMQRVALARALVVKPSLLLLDEPMSNLDASVRSRLRSELKLIQQEFGQTVLYVTHDQVEAMSMADRIVVMRDGAIEQIGTPRGVYRCPRNLYVARFLGEPPINLLECRVEQSNGRLTLQTKAGDRLPLPYRTSFEGDAILAIRPHHLGVSRDIEGHKSAAEVTDIENLGAQHVLHLLYGGQHLAALAPPRFASIGSRVNIAFDLDHAHVADPATGLIVAPVPEEVFA